ncbi:MAG: phage integrase SAM-like domain-containing protein [bacterium]
MQKVYEFRNNYAVSLIAKAITAERGTGSTSREKIEGILREFKEVTGIKNLHKITDETVKNFYSYIQESGQANSTVANKISYFNQVLEYSGKTELKQTAK